MTYCDYTDQLGSGTRSTNNNVGRSRPTSDSNFGDPNHYYRRSSVRVRRYRAVVTEIKSSDWMEIVDPSSESNPRTVQHSTINGAGLVARVLRGKR